MSWSSHDAARGIRADERRLLRGVCAALVCVASNIASPAAAAVSYSLTAEAGLLAYEDPFLLGGGDREALLAEVSINPGAKFTGADGSSLDLAGTAIARSYSQRYGEFFLGNARATGVVRRGDRLTLNAAASFQRDLSADTLTTDIDSASEPNSVRNTLAADASLVWRPNERSTVTPRVAFERSTFSDSIFLRTTRTLTGEVTYARRLSERTEVGVGGRAATSRSGDIAKFDTLAAFATLNYRLSPSLRLTGEAGVERIRDRSRGQLVASRSEQMSVTARARLCREGQFVSGCINGDLSSSVSALGFLQRQYGAGMTASVTFGSRLSGGLVADYTRSEREEGVSGFTQSAVSVRAVLDRRLSMSSTLSGEVGYRQREIGRGGTAGGGFVGIRLRWQQ